MNDKIDFKTIEELALIHSNSISSSQNKLIESKEYKTANKALEGYNAFIEETGKTLSNPRDFLKFEKTCLGVDYSALKNEKRSNINLELKTLVASQENIKQALDAYCVENYEKYQSVIQDCNSFSKKTGLPLDRVTAAFRFEDQMLRDAITPNLDDSKKTKYELRRKFINAGAKAYEALQDKAMQQFIKDNPDHYMTNQYLKKHPDLKLQQGNNTKDQPAGQEITEKPKGKER